MGVYEGRGTLSRALKQLEGQWHEARTCWDDAQSREFEERFILPLQTDLRTTVSAMDQMAVVLSRIQSECE